MKQPNPKRIKQSKLNHYPNFNKITFADIFKGNTLYLAIGFFISGQLPMLLLSIGADAENNTNLYGIAAVLLSLTILTLAGYVIKKRDRNDAPFRIIPIVIMFIIMFVMSFAILIGYGLIAGEVNNQNNQETLIGILTKYPLVMGYLVIISTPIIEELTFRELLPRTFGSSHFGFVIAAVLFILVHSPSGVFGWLSYSSLTAAFLYMRIRYDNLYMCISLHVLWNAFSVGLIFA